MPKRATAAPSPVALEPRAAHGRLLGEFLRSRRDRSRPADFGLPTGSRRRAPGLRREEAAALCGISPTWYTWIEQGRSAGISAAALNAIARGLNLSRAERTYLFELAARPDATAPRLDDRDGPRLTALLDVISSPAYVLDRHWDAIAWNRQAAELFEGWLGRRSRSAACRSDRRPEDRNLLRYVFLEPRARTFIVDWNARAPRLAAEYRADTAAWRDDPVSAALVTELCCASAQFDATWRSQQVQSREGGLRSFQHPRRGRRHYQQFTLRMAGFAQLRLTVLIAAATGAGLAADVKIQHRRLLGVNAGDAGVA